LLPANLPAPTLRAMSVTLSDIRAAQRRIAGGIYVSPT